MEHTNSGTVEKPYSSTNEKAEREGEEKRLEKREGRERGGEERRGGRQNINNMEQTQRS